MRYESAVEIRKAINSKLDAELRAVLKFSVKRVDFSDLARDSMFFVKLTWPKQGEVPIIAPEFKHATYRMLESLFPRGSGVGIE
jgi:hypothetical protein